MQTKNVGNIERIARVVGGGALAALGVVLLVTAGGPAWRFAIDALLIILGLDFVVTGATGRCPLYRWLGWRTARRAG